MVVNRPYLIALVDQPTGAVLFLRHVEDPTAM
jgi:serine protease inhibitor